MNQLVFIENNKVVTDSLTIAEMFGKNHKDVLRDIRTQMGYAGEEFTQRNFAPGSYIDKNNQERPKELLTEEAFTLVVFSYNTKEAVQTKIKFIQEFKRMKDYILNQQKPSCIEDVLIASLQEMKDVKKKIEAVENKQIEQDKELLGIRNVVAINTSDWRKDTTNLLNKIAKQRGGFEAYQLVRQESYELLESRAKCKLSIRLTNLKHQMRDNGHPKSKVDKSSKLDVIDRDTRLLEIYTAVVKEMAVKEGVA